MSQDVSQVESHSFNLPGAQSTNTGDMHLNLTSAQTPNLVSPEESQVTHALMLPCESEVISVVLSPGGFRFACYHSKS